jgi:hypothetical protein
MSRKDDIKIAQDRLEGLRQRMLEVQKAYQQYHGEVAGEIRGILEEAGVLDQVTDLERERVEARKEAQEKVNGFRRQADSVQQALAFLMDLDGAGDTPADEPEALPEPEALVEDEPPVVEPDPEPDPESDLRKKGRKKGWKKPRRPKF